MTTGPLTVTRHQIRALAVIQEAKSHQDFGERGLALPKELFQRYANACRSLNYPLG